MMYLFAFLAACIFAVELYGNITNAAGVIAWLHLIIIGAIEVFLIGFLVVSCLRWLRSRSRKGARVRK